MSKLTILESESFWEELNKRSPEAELARWHLGRDRLRLALMAAFELKQEYDDKTRPTVGREEEEE